MVLKRPVKWVETRSEHFKSTVHAREVRAKISLAFRKDGKVLALRGTVIADMGAYNLFINANYAPFIAQQLTGPYDIPIGEVRALAVFTNKTPAGPYRGAGRPGYCQVGITSLASSPYEVMHNCYRRCYLLYALQSLRVDVVVENHLSILFLFPKVSWK
jgi:CO/xanthine dehydrogenase Mo-binding subunit